MWGILSTKFLHSKPNWSLCQNVPACALAGPLLMHWVGWSLWPGGCLLFSGLGCVHVGLYGMQPAFFHSEYAASWRITIKPRTARLPGSHFALIRYIGRWLRRAGAVSWFNTEPPIEDSAGWMLERKLWHSGLNGKKMRNQIKPANQINSLRTPPCSFSGIHRNSFLEKVGKPSGTITLVFAVYATTYLSSNSERQPQCYTPSEFSRSWEL